MKAIYVTNQIIWQTVQHLKIIPKITLQIFFFKQKYITAVDDGRN